MAMKIKRGRADFVLAIMPLWCGVHGSEQWVHLMGHVVPGRPSETVTGYYEVYDAEQQKVFNLAPNLVKVSPTAKEAAEELRWATMAESSIHAVLEHQNRPLYIPVEKTKQDLWLDKFIRIDARDRHQRRHKEAVR